MTISEVYLKEIKIIGATRGTRKEMLRLIDMASINEIKPVIWKTFNLDNIKTAINSLFSRERNRRILIKIAG